MFWKVSFFHKNIRIEEYLFFVKVYFLMSGKQQLFKHIVINTINEEIYK